MSVHAKSARRKPAASNDEMSYETFECLANRIHIDLAKALDGSKSFRDTYLLKSFISKLGTAKIDENARRLAAISLTREDERLNAKTNNRLSKHLRLVKVEGDTSYKYKDLGVDGDGIKLSRNKKASFLKLDPSCKKVINGIPFDSILAEARYLLQEVLGDFTYGVFEQGKFTPGASVGFPKSRQFKDKDGNIQTEYFTSMPDQKFRKRVTCTPSSYAFVIAMIRATPLWCSWMERKFGPDHRRWVKIVKGNVGFTVRKNAEVDRFCAKEASGNMMLQNGLGNHIRENLRRFGIDLNDFTRNQYWAWVGSITGGYATLDLKSASNSLTVMLVRLLLSDEWFDAFNMCRSHYGTYDGVTSHRWEMFSSMGNGFTFELESLIFWALSESVRRLMLVPGITTVFGDDIIVPTTVAHSVIAVLNYCGFRINTDKSFVKGDFRESCGGHYKNGEDVTPLYIRKPIVDTCGVIHVLNSLRKWGAVGGLVDDRLTSVYRKYRRRVATKYWGGNRLSSRTSLASPGAPKLRLKYADRRKIIDGVPALLQNLMYKEAQNGRNETLPLDSPDRVWFVGSEDPQIIFEIMGKIPVTHPAAFRTSFCKENGIKRKTRIQVTEMVTLLEIPVGHEPNTEPPLEDIPYFLWEIPTMEYLPH